MSSFEYPRLPRKDIIAIFAETQIASVSDSDFLQPRSEWVKEIYTKLLMYLDLLQDETGQVEFAALEQLENPDRHVDSVGFITLSGKIKELLEAIRCPWVFNLKDLLHPDAQRTEIFVGSILNYCLFKDNKINQLKQIVEELSIQDERCRQIEERIAELNSEIGMCNEAREREIPLAQELEAQVYELRQAVASLNSHQLTLRTVFHKKKEKSTELQEKISNADFTLVQRVQEHANLHAKIVQSPDKLQKALEDKKSVLVEAKNAERAAMLSFHAKKAILEVYTKTGKKMSKHLTQMLAIHEQVTSVKTTEKDVKALRIKLENESVLDKSLDAKLVERQGKAEQMDALRNQLLIERDVKCGEATKELSRVKMDVELGWKDLSEKQRKAEAVVAEVEAVKSKIETVKAAGAAKQEAILRKGEEVVNAFNQYSDSLNARLPK